MNWKKLKNLHHLTGWLTWKQISNSTHNDLVAVHKQHLLWQQYLCHQLREISDQDARYTESPTIPCHPHLSLLAAQICMGGFKMWFDWFASERWLVPCVGKKIPSTQSWPFNSSAGNKKDFVCWSSLYFVVKDMTEKLAKPCSLPFRLFLVGNLVLNGWNMAAIVEF